MEGGHGVLVGDCILAPTRVLLWGRSMSFRLLRNVVDRGSCCSKSSPKHLPAVLAGSRSLLFWPWQFPAQSCGVLDYPKAGPEPSLLRQGPQ